MKSKLILKNIGDIPSVEITLQVSYFVTSDKTHQVKGQEFVVIMKGNQEAPQEVDFGDSAIEELEVLLLIQKPRGNIITQKSFSLKEIGNKPQQIDFTINQEIDYETLPII